MHFDVSRRLGTLKLSVSLSVLASYAQYSTIRVITRRSSEHARALSHSSARTWCTCLRLPVTYRSRHLLQLLSLLAMVYLSAPSGILSFTGAPMTTHDACALKYTAPRTSHLLTNWHPPPHSAQLQAVCEVVLPSDPAYDRCRDAWNKDIVGRPSEIARPANTAQVSGVVKWAVANGKPPCVASGRHSIHASKTGVLMIDLSKLTQLEVNPTEKTVVVGPGIRLREFDEACAKHGLATTAGTNPDTGVAGLTLGWQGGDCCSVCCQIELGFHGIALGMAPPSSTCSFVCACTRNMSRYLCLDLWL